MEELSLKGLGRYANIGPLPKLSHPTFSVFYGKQNVEQAPLCFPAQIEITLQTGADCDSGEMNYLIFTVLVVSHKLFVLTKHHWGKKQRTVSS